jgi:hypothetical protein
VPHRHPGATQYDRCLPLCSGELGAPRTGREAKAALDQGSRTRPAFTRENVERVVVYSQPEVAPATWKGSGWQVSRNDNPTNYRVRNIGFVCVQS